MTVHSTLYSLPRYYLNDLTSALNLASPKSAFSFEPTLKNGVFGTSLALLLSKYLGPLI